MVETSDRVLHLILEHANLLRICGMDYISYLSEDLEVQRLVDSLLEDGTYLSEEFAARYPALVEYMKEQRRG